MKTQSKTNQVFRGIVRNVNYNNSNNVSTFRLEQLDDDGDIAGYNVVEFRNLVTTDIAAEGDTVEIIGTLRENTIYPQNIHNLTTGKTLKCRSSWSWWSLFLVIGIPIMLFIFIVIAINIFVNSSTKLRTSSLSNCTIQVDINEELLDRPSPFDGLKVGELKPNRTYRATRISQTNFGPWFYVDNGSVRGWVTNHRLTFRGNCRE